MEHAGTAFSPVHYPQCTALQTDRRTTGYDANSRSCRSTVRFVTTYYSGLTFVGNVVSIGRLYACCVQQRCRYYRRLFVQTQNLWAGKRRDIHAPQAVRGFHFRAVNRHRNSRKGTHRNPYLLHHIRRGQMGGT